MNIELANGKATAPCVFTKSAFKSAIAEAGYFEDGNIHTEYGWRKDEPAHIWCRVKRIVLFDDPDSVSLVDAKVWRDNSTGTAFMEQGRDAESRARENASTHKRCNTCSELYRKDSWCSQCSKDRERQRFNRLKAVPYQDQPCVIGDSWHFDPDSLRDYLLEHDIMPSDAEVEEAEPHDLPEIELEHWCDDLPEDYDEYTLPDEIMNALDALNRAIRKHGKGVTYFRSGNRITLPDGFVDGG
ncbi:hypothetical protein [uncultured Paraglaciecola sp.]|uniref:hypothetical protein n=1 Tax=uncultured Paraglaciecola sp. TaxID=1765024 RepID=UPI002606C5FB|nr:hypothetical protein [uncultured Paraglaciecola sp.]